jgi:hypothetical protein
MGRSRITLEFAVGRDIDAAANDIRDRVSAIVDDLPEEAEPPDIQKQDSNEDVIMWLNLAGDGMSIPELTDYAAALPDGPLFRCSTGVARVRIGWRPGIRHAHLAGTARELAGAQAHGRRRRGPHCAFRKPGAAGRQYRLRKTVSSRCARSAAS